MLKLLYVFFGICLLDLWLAANKYALETISVLTWIFFWDIKIQQQGV